MSGEVAYVDSSAAVKLVALEPGSKALRRWFEQYPERASATLLRIEVVRAARRSGFSSAVRNAQRYLRSIRLITLSPEVVDRAAWLEPLTMRSLDAVHLASALALGESLGVIVSYDQRLIAAADALGLPVASPG